MNTERILSRRDLDFPLFDWLRADAFRRSSRFADHNRETFDRWVGGMQKIYARQVAAGGE